MSKGSAVFAWVKLLAPIILARIPATRPIAGNVALGMEQAEELFGPGKGAEKLEHVKALATNVGEALNQAKPGTVNLPALNEAVTEGIDTAFAIAKIAADNHGAPTSTAAVLPHNVPAINEDGSDD